MSLLGLDVGTTGCKAVVFNLEGKLLSTAYREYPLLHPQPGWAELDMRLVLKKIKESIQEVSSQAKKDPVKAFSIASQGEAFVPIDKRRGIYLAIALLVLITEERISSSGGEKPLGQKRL